MESLTDLLEIQLDLNSKLKTLEVQGRLYKYLDLSEIPQIHGLPYCLRILVESCLRQSLKNEEWSEVWIQSAQDILQQNTGQEVLFQPGRVVLQDFTGVAALVDLAAMRDMAVEQGQDPKKVDSKCPADLVVDHSVQVDFSQVEKLLQKQQREVEEASEAALKQHQQAPQPQTYMVPSNPYPAFFPMPPPGHLEGGEVYYYPVQDCQYGAAALPMHPHPEPIPVVQPLQNPVPNDNPGLPIQDEVCPFHQRMSYWSETLQKNRRSEMQKNDERFQFLKWVDSTFENVTVVPPGTGVMHQVNLEYLSRLVAVKDDQVLIPDTCVGTDTHTTLVNGLGVLGWTVGTLEAEAVMFDHPLSFKLPRVIGVKLIGKVPSYATSMDVVLLITKDLRKQLQVKTECCRGAEFADDIFVEFFGSGVSELSIADRTAIANLCAEYGAKTGYFPVDEQTLDYLAQTGREQHSIQIMKSYLQKSALFRSVQDADDNVGYDKIIEIFLPDIVVTISGPCKPKDKVELGDVAKDFQSKFGPSLGILNLNIDGQVHTVQNGSVLLTSIASCSNSSNPSVMLTAGLLAKKAVEAGLSVPKYVKRSLSPGAGVVTSYLQDSGVMPYLHMLGFEVMGYGCSSCVENSAAQPLIPPDALVCCGVLSGNRNFEGRILPEIKANYLASPPLVIAYALAGRIDIDLQHEPIGQDDQDKPVYLRDIWPSRSEVQEVEKNLVIPSVFKLVSNRLRFGNKEWSNLNVPAQGSCQELFQWSPESTFIRPPSYLKEMMVDNTKTTELKKMRCLLKLEDDVTCDLISPAGSIVRSSAAGEYLLGQGLVPRQFQSFGARRGNSEVMSRGTFSHNKLKNLMHTKSGPYTIHSPSGVSTTIYEASQRYKADQIPLVVIAGANFGRGSARDWATKGPYLLGVRAICAQSFCPAYKHNMIKTGLLPIQITEETFKLLTGHEAFEIQTDLESSTEVKIIINEGEKILEAKHCLANAYEVNLYMKGGVICQFLNMSLAEK